MAEFCKKCFIEIFAPSPEEVATIVLSDEDDLDYCEGCMTYGRYVVSVGGGPSECIDEYDDDYDEDGDPDY